MRSRFSRPQDDGDDEDEANWQDSYSDLMTDLLAIFVILFSFAMMSQAFEASKAKAASAQMASVELRQNTVQEKTANIKEIASKNRETIGISAGGFNSLYEYIKTYIEEEGLSEQLSVTKIGEKEILLRVAASAFFDSGKADIREDSEHLLHKISDILMMYQDSIEMVRIEGHTDNVPINTLQYNSNWELSAGRAVNVLKWLLEESDIEAAKISAIGYSEFHPVADNNTLEGRSKNRRVDFFIEAISNVEGLDEVKE